MKCGPAPGSRWLPVLGCLAVLGSASFASAATPELLACGTAKASPELERALADGVARSIENTGPPISEEDGHAVAAISVQCGMEHKMSLAAMRPYFEFYLISIGRQGLRKQLAAQGYDALALDTYVAGLPADGTGGESGLDEAIARSLGGRARSDAASTRLPRIYVTAGSLAKRLQATLP